MLIQLLSKTGKQRVVNNYGISINKGMGLNAAYKNSLKDETLTGDNHADFKDIQIIERMYDQEEQEANNFLTSLFTLTALNKKFEDTGLQNLLLTTGNSIIEWDSPYNRYKNLVAGTNTNRGGNYVGVTMMDIREKLKDNVNVKKVIVKTTKDIKKLVESDDLVKSWVSMRIKDMSNTVNRFQQYLKIKDNFEYNLSNSTSLIRLVNYIINNIYYPCERLNNLEEKRESDVPSFIVDIISKSKGMSTGELPLKILNSKGDYMYNKNIQEKINENVKQVSKLNDDFFGRIRTIEHSKEEAKEFNKHQLTEYIKFFNEISISTISDKDQAELIKNFNKGQNDEYQEFWGIEKNKKSKDDINRHINDIKKLKNDLGQFIRREKQKNDYYSSLNKEFSQIYWNKILSMFIFLIKSLKQPLDSNIRTILIKSQLLNSEPKKCIYIISNKSDNCIVSALLNIIKVIIQFKEEFSYTKILDTDDVKLAGSIILDQQFKPSILYKEDEDEEQKVNEYEDEEQKVNEYESDEEQNENDEENVDDYGEVNESDQEKEENYYEDDASFNIKWGVKSKKINDEDIEIIKEYISKLTTYVKNTEEIAIEIIEMVNTIKNSNMSLKIKQNRINFFATMK